MVVRRKLRSKVGHASRVGVGKDAEGKARRKAREPVRAAIRLDDEEKSQINLKTHVSHGTIENYAAGYPVQRTNRIRIEEQLERLGIKRKDRERVPGQGRRRRVVETKKDEAAE